jgi:hypothetical protein
MCIVRKNPMEFNENDELTNVIEDAVNDSITPDTTTSDTDTTAVEAPDASAEDTTTSDDSSQIPTPATSPEAAEGDEFDKRFGLQSQSVTGRENRIPYSRVKKIVTKAEKDTEARIRKELEGTSVPKLTEYETKVKDYEGRLERVAQFEQILENDPKQFLGMLSKIPAYRDFFAFVEQAAQQQAPPAKEEPYLDHSDMPQPDQVLSDGSKVYSLEGLAKRDEWLARKIESRAIAQAEDRFSKRYAPIEQAWQSQEQMNRMVPVVERQIAEARTWDKFAELEPRIVEILKSDKSISLERAHSKAYQEWSAGEFARLSADRNKIRTEILSEIKSKPISSGAPVAGVKPAKMAPTGPRSMEDIIMQSLEDAGLTK